jgi:hypothetical protein
LFDFGIFAMEDIDEYDEPQEQDEDHPEPKQAPERRKALLDSDRVMGISFFILVTK